MKNENEFYKNILTNLYLEIENDATNNYVSMDNQTALKQIANCLAYKLLKERYENE